MPLADQMAPVAGLLQELGEQLDTRVQAVGVEPGVEDRRRPLGGATSLLQPAAAPARGGGSQ